MIADDKKSCRVLVIDDDTRLCQLIREYFADSVFSIQAAFDGPSGLAQALEGDYDVILLDVMLPGMDGFTVLTQLRRRSEVPVMMLTARGALQDRVNGLNTGADDYLAKPFGPEELDARMRAIMRRTGRMARESEDLLSIAQLRLSPATKRAWIQDLPVDITCTEFDILDLLVRANGRIVTRNEVCGMLYQRMATPFERSLEVHISRLRKKTASAGIVIRSIRGTGYLLALDDQQ
jgi:two-component system response regulator CpxR